MIYFPPVAAGGGRKAILAAFFANQNSVDYPQHDLMTNGLGTLLVHQYAQMCGTGRLIYASSGCSIYGSEAPLPMTESFM